MALNNYITQVLLQSLSQNYRKLKLSTHIATSLELDLKKTLLEISRSSRERLGYSTQRLITISQFVFLSADIPIALEVRLLNSLAQLKVAR